MTTGAFDNAGSNGPAASEVGRVVHVREIAFKVSGGGQQLFAHGRGGGSELGPVSEIPDQVGGLTGKQEQRLLLHPREAHRGGFAP